MPRLRCQEVEQRDSGDPERTQTVETGHEHKRSQCGQREGETIDIVKTVSSLLLLSACTAQAPHLDSQPWTSAVFGLYCFTPYDW